MPDTKTCTRCNGSGEIEYLVSQHDDVKEWGSCNSCNGRGVIHYMTDDEEEDYKRNNDW